MVFFDEEKDTSAVASGEVAPPVGGVEGEFSPTGGTLATLRGVPKYLKLRVRGTIQGLRVSVLVDSGATHKFIDTQLV